MRSFLNVVLPLLLPAHPAQRAAREWFTAQPDASVGWCLPIRLGVLRLLCDPEVMGRDALAPAQAMDVWAAHSATPQLTEISHVPVEHETHLRRLVSNRELSPNIWTDAWLASLAICHSCEMVTFDRGSQRFDGVSLRLLA